LARLLRERFDLFEMFNVVHDVFTPAIASPQMYLPLVYGDETAYILDMYSGDSLDTCDISIDFPTHFGSIFDYFDILWFISISQRTGNITC
jgi:hypothetical protein